MEEGRRKGLNGSGVNNSKPLEGPERRLSLVLEKEWHWVNSHIHELAARQDPAVPCLPAPKDTSVNGGRMKKGKKTFAVVLQHCSEVECLCIDLTDRENREIFHMFISRTPRNKQPSLSLSVLPTQGPASAGYKNPSVSRWGSIIVAKAHGLKDSYSAPPLFASLSALFIHQMCTRCSEETLHHLSCAGVSALLLKNLQSTKSHGHLSIYIQIWRLSTTKSGKWKHFLQVKCQHFQL